MNNDTTFYEALLNKDSSFEETFIAGIKTTGIFCRPTCPARKPKRENVEFFPSTKEALLKGYRACKICKPMEKAGTAPEYVKKVLSLLEKDPSRKLKDYDLRQLTVEPSQIRRWFQKNHGITFHTYQRMLRINQAFQKYQQGQNVTDIAFDSGYNSLSGFNSSFKNVLGTSPKKSTLTSVINLTRLETTLGTMIACATEQGICLLEFSDRKMLETEFKILAKALKAPILQSENKHFSFLEQEVTAYFTGTLTQFSVPLHLIGTDFQKQVWSLLLQLPYGTTSTYAQQAKKLQKPSAIRAIANANGMNKIAIIIPCHKVIGSDGSLTGYSGGIWRKQNLLELEQENV